MPTPETTTIQITVARWQQLNQLKERPGESFDDVIGRLIASYSDDSGHSDDSSNSDSSTTATPATDAATVSQQSQSPAAGADTPQVPDSVPGRIPTADAHSAIQAACEHVHEEGAATKKEIVQAVMPDHALGYDVPDLASGTRYRGAWWRKIIKPGLEQAESIEKPAQHASEWRSLK